MYIHLLFTLFLIINNLVYCEMNMLLRYERNKYMNMKIEKNNEKELLIEFALFVVIVVCIFCQEALSSNNLLIDI